MGCCSCKSKPVVIEGSTQILPWWAKTAQMDVARDVNAKEKNKDMAIPGGGKPILAGSQMAINTGWVVAESGNASGVVESPRTARLYSAEPLLADTSRKFSSDPMFPSGGPLFQERRLN